jgi:hypothetical protein
LFTGGWANGSAVARSIGGSVNGPARAVADVRAATNRGWQMDVSSNASASAQSPNGDAVALSRSIADQGKALANATAEAQGRSGSATSLSVMKEGVHSVTTGAAVQLNGTAGDTVHAWTISANGQGSDLGVPWSGLSPVAYSVADGRPMPWQLAALNAEHPRVAAALDAPGTTAVGLGQFGMRNDLAPNGLHTYSSSAEYTFRPSGESSFVLGLLDMHVGGSVDTPWDLHFSVREGANLLLDQEFMTRAAATDYFSDHALQLGQFSGNVDLSLSFVLTTDQLQNVDARYVLGATGVDLGPAPVPDAPALPMMLMGGAVLWWRSRRRALQTPVQA